MNARELALLCVLAFAAACNGPLPFLSGGKLGGETAPVPANWSGVAESGTGQLETRPSDPYSVNLVYTVMNGKMYVNAGGTETRWVKNMETDPAVRLRIDDKLYALRAERVTDPAEIKDFGAAWTSQSTFRRDPSKLEQAWIFRLAPR